MNGYETTSGGANITFFPFRLPDEFLVRVGYRGTDHLVGLYWHADAAELVAYDRTRFWYGGHSSRPWQDLINAPLVRHWLAEHYVDLGDDPIDLPSHHLIVIREANVGFLVQAASAIRIVQCQSRG